MAPEAGTYYNIPISTVSMPNTEDGTYYNHVQEMTSTEDSTYQASKSNDAAPDTKYDSLILSDKSWVILVKYGLFDLTLQATIKGFISFFLKERFNQSHKEEKIKNCFTQYIKLKYHRMKYYLQKSFPWLLSASSVSHPAKIIGDVVRADGNELPPPPPHPLGLSAFTLFLMMLSHTWGKL